MTFALGRNSSFAGLCVHRRCGGGRSCTVRRPWLATTPVATAIIHTGNAQAYPQATPAFIQIPFNLTCSNTARTVNRFLEPAFFAGNEANDDLNRHSIKFGAAPRPLPMPDRPDAPNGLIAYWQRRPRAPPAPTRPRAGRTVRPPENMFSVPLFYTFSQRCCRNVTVANRRCDTVRAVLTARIVRSHGLYHWARGGSRNEPTLRAALDLGHACRVFW